MSRQKKSYLCPICARSAAHRWRNPASTYLLDANTFIQAKNTYYHMDVCPGYWRWIEIQAQAGEVCSIDSIRDELLNGNDVLKEWAKERKEVFLSVSDDATQQAFAEIAAHAAEIAKLMKPGVLNEFLAGADPWLIAKAKSSNAIVVTHEIGNPQIKRKILIPNVCDHFKVPYLNTFDLLLKLEAEFVLPA